MTHTKKSHAPTPSKEQEYLEGWQRSRAELVNFRKRVDEAQREQTVQAKRTTIALLLPIADNFRSMLAHVPTELAANAWVQGVSHIARQMEQLLADLGVQAIGATDVPFDPTQHEAIEEVESAAPSHTVVEVVQPGYKLGDVLLRPARVKIAK